MSLFREAPERLRAERKVDEKRWSAPTGTMAQPSGRNSPSGPSAAPA